MSVDVILGLQWGDEGKGKIVDLLSQKYPIIARFQGGPNAGHTIIIGDKKFVLHQIPSGMTREGVINVIGNGVILDPIILRMEIERLESAGIDVKSRLLVSRKANLILPTHKLIDATRENNADNTKIGSTQKGIGPTYQDKTGRFGLRTGDIFTADFKSRYEKKKNTHLSTLRALGHDGSVDDKEWFEAVEYIRQLQFIDSEYYLNEQISTGTSILAEGAQGTLLDIDFGTYPYVTSSNTISASVCTGLGIAPKHIRKTYGIFKAYTTRVGEGPFPTELHDETGELIRKKGHEFGSTTGRPRRCGWLDLPALDYAIMLNGVDELIMMKADVLDGLETLKVCTDYKDPEGTHATFSDMSFYVQVQPEYKEISGWKEPLEGATSYETLPQDAKDYIKFIEQQVGKPVSIISTGPERNQTIVRQR